MPDLKNMWCWEAVGAAVEASGLTNKEIAHELGISASQIRRYRARGDAYSPSMAMVPKLCEVLENRILLDWMEEQYAEPNFSATPPANRAAILTLIARLTSSVGDVNALIADTDTTGIRPSDAYEIRSAVLDVINECRQLNSTLQHLACQRGQRQQEVLASLNPEPAHERPWWRFWGAPSRGKR